MSDDLIGTLFVFGFFMFLATGILYLVYRHNSGADDLAMSRRLLRSRKDLLIFEKENKLLEGKSDD